MKKKIIIITLLSLFFSSVVGTASWYTNIKQDFKPELSPSGLTEHLVNLTGDSYIYDNGTTATGYTAISSDPTWDENERTINLGYVNKEITINGNAYFTHNDAKITYSESEYTGGTLFTPTNGESDYKYFSWINECYNTSKRLYTIKLVGNVTLAEGCTLSIGAFIGRTYMNGFNGPIIQGNFITLDLNGYTLKIEKGATLNAYGYIIDTSLDENGNHKGLIDNYGTIYSSFIVENYSGGGTTVATAAFGTAPFTIYSVPYLSCKTIFHDTSSLKCPASLYTYPSSKKIYITTIYYGGFSKAVIDMIGSSSSLIKINSGSMLIKDSYNDPTILNTPALYGQNYKSYYEFNGDIDVETMFLDVVINSNDKNGNKTGKLASQKINMAEYGFTLPPYIHIEINSGTTSIGMLIDFLPGSSLYVDSNATIEFKTLTIDKNQTLGGSNDITTYGGVRMLSLMTAESSTCYSGLSYGATNAAYDAYRISEASLNTAGNVDSRAIIDGNILVSSTNNDDKHIIGGKINLSDEAKKYIESSDRFNAYAKKYDYYAYISGSDLISNRSISKIQEAATNKVCASYSILPLVSYGKVLRTKDIDDLLDKDNTAYDFSEGVFISNSKTYAFIPNNDTATDASGSLKEVNHDSDKHIITDKNTSKTFSFYRNMFVENSGVSDDSLYVYDNLYSGYSTNKYHAIDSTNDLVNYTYKYFGKGTTSTGKRYATLEGSYSWSLFGGYSYDFGEKEEWYDKCDWSKDLIDESNTSEITTTINYKTENVSVIKYNFNYSSQNYGDINTYKNFVSYSLLNRPIYANKFLINDESKYYQIGTINLNISIKAGEEITYKDDKDSIYDDESTIKRGSFNLVTKKIYLTTTKNNNEISDQTWSSNNRPMYVKIRKTCIKWNPSLGIWVKV